MEESADLANYLPLSPKTPKECKAAPLPSKPPSTKNRDLKNP